ncbi:hypothetical protein T03_12475 [Trichinella britovi]|uniref:Uncharacterized protein n=1 Tax=Trichinella britovi TaxID=45882 RepID=A0A0V1AJA3_TRIBR|nr:hypothetical protein T03_12475 [Trichinella britovi]
MNISQNQIIGDIINAKFPYNEVSLNTPYHKQAFARKLFT